MLIVDGWQSALHGNIISFHQKLRIYFHWPNFRLKSPVLGKKKRK